MTARGSAPEQPPMLQAAPEHQICRPSQHLEVLDTGRLATVDLERALPLLLDMTDVVHGTAAATSIGCHAVDTAGPDPRRRALILALASDIAYGIRGGRRAAAMEAIRCAEAAGAAAVPALHRALINLLVVKVTAGEGLDGELLERAERLEADLPGLRLHDTADLHRGLWSRYVEDLGTALAAMQRSIVRARNAGDDYALWTFLCYLVSTEELAGDYAAAAAALDAADAVAGWHDWPPSAWHLEPRCELLMAAGHLDEALSIADERLPDDETFPVAARFVGACVRGKVSAWRGDQVAAVADFERAAWCAEQSDWADPGGRYRLDTWLAEAYVAVGRPDDARRISAWLRDLGRRLGRPVAIGDASRIDALDAAESGDLDAAAQSAQAAVTAHGSAPLRLELARSLLVLGRIERRRKSRRRSRAAVQRAFELAAEIGHRPLQAEIQRELPRLTPARSGHKLTVTEQGVAELIANGATNRDAAAALFVSVRTVETHVASIYRKLGVRTRAELARRLPGTSAR
jgi:ATP/maltotriose-dependent transcriptional regulator MalT